MEAVAVESVEQGCYDLRGPNVETVLISQLTGVIGDADRLIRRGSRRDDPWNNGFPNFPMYRVFLAGDTHLRRMVNDWCIAFAVAHAEENLRHGDKDAAGYFAGQDGYRWLLDREWEYGEGVAEAIGITPKTYRRFRDSVLARLQASLSEYWLRLQFATLQVRIMDKRVDAPMPIVRHSNGRGFEGELDTVGEGNFRAFPKQTG